MNWELSSGIYYVVKNKLWMHNTIKRELLDSWIESAMLCFACIENFQVFYQNIKRLSYEEQTSKMIVAFCTQVASFSACVALDWTIYFYF